nr:TraR/DksA C4-type zinc finger protein [Kordiimonas marina]
MAAPREKEIHFGECHECGDPIEPARLKAVPGAMLCIDCQQAAERKAR